MAYEEDYSVLYIFLGWLSENYQEIEEDQYINLKTDKVVDKTDLLLDFMHYQNK